MTCSVFVLPSVSMSTFSRSLSSSLSSSTPVSSATFRNTYNNNRLCMILCFIKGGQIRRAIGWVAQRLPKVN